MTAPASIDTPKPKLRWYQFSLRSLLVLVTLFGFACSWFAVKMKQAKRQQETVEAFKKIDGAGGISYDFEELGSHAPLGPKWMHRLLGIDFFANITRVIVSKDSPMSYLPEFSELRSLNGLSSYGPGSTVSITDVGIENLKGLAQLEKLYLEQTGISDTGLQNLKGLAKLRVLSLTGSRITNIDSIGNLSQLEEIDLAGSQITDDGLKSIKRLSNLRILHLADTKITNDGLRWLEGLSHLKELHLSATKISDEGLKYLAKMPRLEELLIGNTAITGRGLRYLKGLNQLKKLDITYTKVTAEELDTLQNIPNLEALKIGSQSSFSLELENSNWCATVSRYSSENDAKSCTEINESSLIHLTGLKNLQILELDGVDITDNGWVYLNKLKHLRQLTIHQDEDRFSKVNDAALRQIAKISTLKKLDLANTKVTNEGLSYLEGLTGLEELKIYSTEDTSTGLQKLNKAIPKLNIEHHPFY
jgi:internalin A